MTTSIIVGVVGGTGGATTTVTTTATVAADESLVQQQRIIDTSCRHSNIEFETIDDNRHCELLGQQRHDSSSSNRSCTTGAVTTISSTTTSSSTSQQTDTTSTTRNRGSDSHSTTNNNRNKKNDHANDHCGVYLAPSTIPGAGMGMFAGRGYRTNEYITTGDIVIPLIDWTLQNEHIDVQLLVMQSYYWLTFMFRGMTEDAADSLAFVPGVGAAINCYFPLENTQGYDAATKWSNAGLHRSKDPGVGAFTPYHDRVSYALRDIKAGEELFTDYGEGYFINNEETYGKIPLYDSYESADELLEEYVTTRNTYIDDVTSRRGSSTTTTSIHDDLYNLMITLSKVWPSRILNALPQDPTVVDEIVEIGTSYVHYNRSIRTLDWLDEYGSCMDNIVAGTSHIDQAGRGAFAKRFIPEGGLVGPAPVVHLDRDLMYMYPRQYDEEYHNSYRFNRTAEPIGYQILMNYCFGHDESSVLLCPYGMLTSLINHAPTKDNKANAKVVWNLQHSQHPEWLHLSPKEWLHNVHVGLYMEFIATRDIEPGEEVTIDYGESWENAWNEYVASWSPPEDAEKYRPAFELNEDPDLVIATIDEGSYYDGNLLELQCRDHYRLRDGFEEYERDNHNHYYCSVLLRSPVKTQRQQHNGSANIEYSYVAIIQERYDEDDVCWEEDCEVLFDVPRDAFKFVDIPYTRDIHQPWAFRHPIGIPDDLMPEEWKDLVQDS